MPPKRKQFNKLAKILRSMTEEAKLNLVATRSIINTDGKSLSLNNAVLMIMQRPDNIPTIVGGYRQWQRADRQVMEGERGLNIWYPSKKKVEEGEEGSVRFFVGTVFDVSQTEEREAKNGEYETN